MKAMQELMFSSTPLSEKLSSEQQNRLAAILKDHLGMSLEQVDNYTMTTLMSLLMISSVECPVKKVLDMELHALAEKAGKPVHALETFKQQLEFMEKAYPDEIMLQQLELMDEYAGLIDQMVAAFKAEDLTALMNLLKDERFHSEELEYWLLEVRNQNWAEKMPAIMQTGSTLFAVGAGHLPGEQGVIQLLQNAGYTVTPIK